MSLKSFLPAAAALAVATVALTGCSQTANVSGGDSSAPAASSAPEASSNPRTDTKTDSSTDSGKSDTSKDSGKSDASGVFTVNESNAHVEIPAGTKSVVVNGSNNHIEGEAVSEITINGSQNAVDVKSVQTVSFTGSNNAIQYEDGNAPVGGREWGAHKVVSPDFHPPDWRGAPHTARHPSSCKRIAGAPFQRARNCITNQAWALR